MRSCAPAATTRSSEFTDVTRRPRCVFCAIISQLAVRRMHAHVGSQIFDAQVYVANASALLDAARAIRSGRIRNDAHRSIGGGFGVRGDSKCARSSRRAGDDRRRADSRKAARRRKRACRCRALGIEPGRAIVADAGTTLYRVLAVKRQNAPYLRRRRRRRRRKSSAGALRRPSSRRSRPLQTMDDEIEMTLCGRSCENDELGIVPLPRDDLQRRRCWRCARPARTPIAWRETTTVFRARRSSGSPAVPLGCWRAAKASTTCSRATQKLPRPTMHPASARSAL